MSSVRGRILVICPYPEGVAAGQRLKFEQYYPEWRAAGYEVTVAPFMDMALWRVLYEPGHRIAKFAGIVRGYLRRIGQYPLLNSADLVFIHMWATPEGSSLAEKVVRRKAPRLIYDVEDNIVAARPPVTGWIRRMLGPLVDRTRKVRRLIRDADLTIVASPYLAGPYGELTQGRVQLIPPSLDMAKIVPAPESALQRKVPVIGWTGTFSSRVYLDLLAPMFQKLATRAEFVLRVIGNFDYDLPGVNLDVVRWTSEREAEDLQSLDIGVYPLVDDEWTRGKAGLKIIQYHAAGLPCVASDIPLSREQIREGETGFLVNDEAAWIEKLERLLGAPALRRKMGMAGRADAERLYSREAVGKRYLAILHDLTNDQASDSVSK